MSRVSIVVALVAVSGCLIDTGPDPDTTPDTTPPLAICDDPEVTVSVEAGTLTEDEVWPCPRYELHGDVFVEATLTILPGVTVALDGSAALVVGHGAPGALIADGTGGPITFTSTDPIGVPGAWEGVVVDALATEAVFRGVTFAYGGNYTTDGSQSGEGALVVVSSAEIEDCTFTESEAYAIDFKPGAAASAFANNTFAASGVAPIRVFADSVGSLVGSHGFDPGDGIEVEAEPVSSSATWSALGAPYRVGGDVYVEGVGAEARLTVAPGVTVEFDGSAALITGHAGPASIEAVGTAQEPIVFTSSAAVPAPGDWEGVVVDALTTDATFHQVEFRYGGNYTTDASTAGDAALHIVGTAASITSCGFHDSAGHGVDLRDGAEALSFRDNDFSGNLGDAIRVETDHAGTLGAPNTFDAGALVQVRGGTVSRDATWADLGTPWRVSGDVFVESSADPAILTLGPGAELRFDSSVAVVVGLGGGGGLVADAAGASPIRLRSVESVPGPGDWEGLILDANTTHATLDNVIVEHAGNYTTDGSMGVAGGVVLIDSSASIVRSTLRDNDQAGLVLLGTAAAVDFHDNSFAGAPTAVVTHPDAVSTLSAPNSFGPVDEVHVAGGTVRSSGSWAALGAPYRITGDVYVEGPEAPVVTLLDGATLRFEGSTAMIVGAGDAGGLVADGTIAFTSAAAVPQAGDWEALVFDGNTTTGILRGVSFSYCGNYTTDGTSSVDGCVGVVDSAPTIDSCAFAHSSGHGIHVRGAGAPDLLGNAFSDVAGSNVALD